MASPKLLRGRVSETDAFYSITMIVAARRPVFADPRLADAVVSELRWCEPEGMARHVAWVVMPDHVHWLMQLKCMSLGRCIQTFKSRSARLVNSMRNASGALWQAGFHDHKVRDHEDLMAHARYIVTNPLRSGLVSRLADHRHWYCPGMEDIHDL